MFRSVVGKIQEQHVGQATRNAQGSHFHYILILGRERERMLSCPMSDGIKLTGLANNSKFTTLKAFVALTPRSPELAFFSEPSLLEDIFIEPHPI